MAEIDIKVEGIERLVNNLKQADKRVQKRVLNAAIKAGGKPVLTAAKNNVPIRTGTLKRSLGSKTKSYAGGSIKTVIIGPRASVTSELYGKPVRPTNYMHLVEKGFNNKRIGRRVEGTEPLEKAFKSTKGMIQKSMEDKLVKGIEKEMSKGNVRA